MGFSQQKLGDVCRLINGRAYKKHEMLSEGPYPILRVGNFFTNRSWFYSDLELNDDKYCDNGDLLYAWSASFGPRIWEGQKVIYHYHIWKIEIDETKVDKHYMFHLLDWDTEQIKLAQGTGTTMVHVTKGAMENRVLPFPSIPEQQHIVAILDQAFADIEKARANAEKNLKNARELFDSYLQQVFSQRGEGWVENSLENVVEGNCSLSYGVVQPGDDFINGLPVVRPTDLKSKIIYVEGLKLIDPLLAKGYERTTLEGGELLLCVRGSTGVVSIADAELAGANVTRGIVPIRFDQSVMLQAFGYYQFISHDIQRQIKSHTYGAALMQINIRDLRKLTVVLPPLQFQSEAINQLDDATRKMRRLEFVYQAKLKSLDELKKSLLQKAFSGELTKSKGIAA